MAKNYNPAIPKFKESKKIKTKTNQIPLQIPKIKSR